MSGAIVHAQQHETAATNISGCRLHHRQRKPGGHRCIHGVATCLHHFNTGLRGECVNAHHHPVGPVLGMHGATGGAKACGADCSASKMSRGFMPGILTRHARPTRPGAARRPRPLHP